MKFSLQKYFKVLFISFWFLAQAWSGLLFSSESFRVATYNLENYLLMERRDCAGGWSVSPKPESEKDALREVIGSVEPDILALQEIGGDLMLLELQSDLAKEGLDYPVAITASAIDETRQLGILSKQKPISWRMIKDLPFRYRGDYTMPLRGLLEIEFSDDAGSWYLYTIHLKSKYTNYKDDPQSLKRRTQEARAIRDYLRDKFGKDGRYIVLGDFNDTIDTAPVRSFLKVNNKPLTQLIPAYDGSGLSWTHYYRKGEVYSRIDLILTSLGMYEQWLPGEAGIVEERASWRASDHRLVYADFIEKSN